MTPLTKRRLKLALQSLIYFVLVVLLLSEIDESAIEECTGFDAPPRAVARGDYDLLIRSSTYREPSAQRVVEVVIDTDSGPADVVSNLCVQREFTARVIERLNELRTSVIALDKFYGRKTCGDDDPGTRQLQEAIHRSHATIILGLDSIITPETKVNGRKVCLKLNRQSTLSFDLPNDQLGLVRMDANTKLVPLVWPVETDEDKPKIIDIPTLSFATAKAANPEVVQTKLIEKAVRTHQQPYSTRVAIPVFSAIRILCGSAYTGASDWRTCSPGEGPRELSNGVVLIGNHQPGEDWHKEVGRQEGLYGVDLQANYVAAILDQRSYIPLLSPESNLFFIGCVLLALHVGFHFFKPLWRVALIAFGVWALMAVVSLLTVSFLGYLFTVWVQGITLTTIATTALHHWNTAESE